MPNFECHVAVASVASAVAVATGSILFEWDNTASSLAFMAGLSGGMVPDLDCDTAKPRRLAGFFVGLGCAAMVVGYVSGQGQFLRRPWPAAHVALAAVGSFFLFSSIFMEILKGRTKHRGLFHSLATPFLYGGLWGCLTAGQGGRVIMAVWFLATLGVFTHLILDAAKGFTFNPLKIASDDLAASTRLWILTALVNFLAFIRIFAF
ncbi:MAG: metal-dependent hydrolase [Deltaproteobacteria bacterium]|nr:metal-dependent hydrolase [Deltaproteobacteria bacterium]